jgi:hypothetical protein
VQLVTRCAGRKYLCTQANLGYEVSQLMLCMTPDIALQLLTGRAEHSSESPATLACLRDLAAGVLHFLLHCTSCSPAVAQMPALFCKSLFRFNACNVLLSAVASCCRCSCLPQPGDTVRGQWLESLGCWLKLSRGRLLNCMQCTHV